MPLHRSFPSRMTGWEKFFAFIVLTACAFFAWKTSP